MTKQEQKDYLIYCIMHELRPQDESTLTQYVNENSKIKYRAYIDHDYFVTDDMNPFNNDDFFKIYIDQNVSNHYGIKSTITSEELQKAKNNKNFVVLPLSIYDHSGVALKVGTPTDKWDSWSCGFIVINVEEMPKDKIIANAEAIIDDFNSYYNGSIFAVSIYEVKKCLCCDKEQETLIDSCSGFYDVESAKNSINYYSDEQIQIIENY